MLAFPSQTSFLVRGFVAEEMATKNCPPPSLPNLGALPYLFTTGIFETSLLCLHNTVSMASSSQVRRVVCGRIHIQ